MALPAASCASSDCRAGSDASVPASSFPALRALLIQCVAFPFAALAFIACVADGLPVAVTGAAVIAAFVQGAVSAALSRRRLAPWWPPIQFLLPPARGAARARRRPPRRGRAGGRRGRGRGGTAVR